MCEQQEGKPKRKNLKIRKNELTCTSSAKTKTKTKQIVMLRKLRVKSGEEAPDLNKKNNEEEDNIK